MFIATTLKQNYCTPDNLPKQKSGTLSQNRVHYQEPEKSVQSLGLGL